MTASISNRKRSREEDGNNEDHVPLSKRINMLHINNNYNIDSNNQHHDHNSIGIISDPSHSQHHHNMHNNGHDPQQQHHHHHQQHQNGHLVDILTSHIDIEDNSTYSPELNQIENPYYYNKNKLLFELHLERCKRNDKI